VNSAPPKDDWDLLNRELTKSRAETEKKQTGDFWNKRLADLLADTEEPWEKPRERS
jgi:hypothetical protein